jgi:hypothetical protein
MSNTEHDRREESKYQGRAEMIESNGHNEPPKEGFLADG